MRPFFRVYVDFDGTISLDDSTDALLERFAEPEWEAAETDWVAGRIGSRECMSRQVAALRLRPEALHGFVGSVQLDPDFVKFVSLARSLSVPVAVVSDGLDLVIQGALRNVGLSLPVFANRMTWQGGDRWSLGFPYSDPNCGSQAGHCKCRSLAVDGAGAVLIGDGRSDYCGAGSADFVFAKASLLDHCRSEGIPHEPFDGFADLAPRFARFATEPLWAFRSATAPSARTAPEAETR